MSESGKAAGWVTDAHVYGGAVIVAAGVGMWSVPAGVAVFGAILLGLGLLTQA